MTKRPKDTPFGALAALRGKVRESGPLRPPPPKPMPRSSDDDVAAFRQAIAGTAPLAPGSRAQIERPRPSPVPRPRPVESEPEPPARQRCVDPDDTAALFRDAMTGVSPLADTGRIEIGRRPRRAIQSAREQPTGQTGFAGEVVLAPLPEDESDPAALFRRAIGEASSLPDRNLAAVDRPRPLPLPIQQQRDEAEALRESIEAPLSFEDRLDIGDEGVHLRDGLPRRVVADLRRGRWVVQGEIDLHGHTRDEARTELSTFITLALDRGWRCIRVIHGKGLGSPNREGVLKYLSRGWLMQREDILAYCQARPHDGGEGALLVLLRNRNKGPAAGD